MRYADGKSTLRSSLRSPEPRAHGRRGECFHDEIEMGQEHRIGGAPVRLTSVVGRLVAGREPLSDCLLRVAHVLVASVLGPERQGSRLEVR